MSAANFEGIDMHGIEPLPSGKFRVRFIRKKRPVGDIVDTIEGAIKLRDALREELASGEVVPLEGLSAAGWGETWLREFRSGNRGYKSERGRFKMHIATAEWARKPLQAVQSPDIISWFQKLQKTPAIRNGKRQKHTLSFQTRRHVRNLGNALFADALGMGLCKTNPFIGLKMKKTSTDRLIERVPEEWPLRPAEQRSVIEILKDDSERWIILFAMGTGLRQGELWNLHVADVHLDVPEGPWVNVRFGSKGKPPKNGRPRKVPLFGMALEAAREWLRVLPTYAPVNPEGLFCPTPAKEKEKKSGGRGRTGGARRQVGKTPRAWTKVKEAFGERKVWWHLLRHTAATSLLCGWWGRKWTLEEVGKLLGHSSVKVTERVRGRLVPRVLAEGSTFVRKSAARRGNRDPGQQSRRTLCFDHGERHSFPRNGPARPWRRDAASASGRHAARLAGGGQPARHDGRIGRAEGPDDPQRRAKPSRDARRERPAACRRADRRAPARSRA